MALIVTSQLRKLIQNKLLTKRFIHVAAINNTLFYEKDPKAGYGNPDNLKKLSKTKAIRDGLKELREEIHLWKNEVQEKFETDPILIHRPGETDIVWNFNSEKKLDRWVVTNDRDHNEGYSSSSLVMNKYGKAAFSGELSTRVPKDGKIQRSGYCNMRSIRAQKSFKRDTYLDWTLYNVLVMRVRGDGRSYMLNIATCGYFDVQWNDIYNYILFTRGGPYWQLTRIPFSKFFLSSKGRIQDKQNHLPLNRVTNFGITCGDKINGEFNLEIDYIGVEYDPNITETFAYEMYKTDKYIVAT